MPELEIGGRKPMKAHQWSYQLRRRTKPHPRFDLHMLLAKELGLCRTRRPRNWIVIAVSISAFIGGLTTVEPAPTGKETTNVFAANAEAKVRQDLSDRILENRHIQIAEIAMSGFGRTEALAVNWRKTSTISLGVMVSQVPAPLSDQTFPVGRSTVRPEGQPVQEFWRSFASSQVVDRYRYYLRRYPTGPFADIAIARIDELGKITPLGVNTRKVVTTDKKVIARSAEALGAKELVKPEIQRKVGTPSSETLTTTKQAAAETAERRASVRLSEIRSSEKSVTVTTIPGKLFAKKTEGRCWSRNIEQCKERCRDGDARACQKLKRLGG
jgi:hypothetical protein